MKKRTAGAVRFAFALRFAFAFCVCVLRLRFAFALRLRFAFALRLRFVLRLRSACVLRFAFCLYSACGPVMGCPRHDHSSSGGTGAVPLTSGVSGAEVSEASSRTLPR